MKRVLFISICISLITSSVNAKTIKDGIFEYIVDSKNNSEATMDGFSSSFTDAQRFSIKKITIPEKVNGHIVTHIGTCAFQSCYSLETLVLPSTIKSIDNGGGRYAYKTYSPFIGCNSLKSIYIYSTTPPSHTVDGRESFYGLGEESNSSVTVYVPATSLEAYRSSWSYFSNISPCTEEIHFDGNLNYRTFYSDVAVRRNGLEAFTVSGIDNEKKTLRLTSISEDSIPAYTGVILKGQKGASYSFDFLYSAKDITESDLLKGTATDTVFSDYNASKPVYILVDRNGVPTFCPMNEASTGGKFTLSAHKAFIFLPDTNSNAYSFTDFVSGIQTAKKDVDNNGCYYGLNGNTSLRPSSKGIYIHNGKKILIK